MIVILFYFSKTALFWGYFLTKFCIKIVVLVSSIGTKTYHEVVRDSFTEHSEFNFYYDYDDDDSLLLINFSVQAQGIKD
jgi:hypothetical protein